MMQTDLWKSYDAQELELGLSFHIFKLKVADHINGLSTDLLSDDEIKKMDRFYHQEDKDAYLVRKSFLRVLIARFLKTSPDQINFETIANKKPHVKGIEFNCSHSGDYILIGISSVPIGIDIQYTDKNFNISMLLDLCLSQHELQQLNGSDDQLLSFYKFWTRKEALLKATGEGLVNNLNEVEVLNSCINRNNNSYQLSTIHNTDYTMSFCYFAERKLTFHFWDSISLT